MSKRRKKQAAAFAISYGGPRKQTVGYQEKLKALAFQLSFSNYTGASRRTVKIFFLSIF
jgi:hypothetical protein